MQQDGGEPRAGGGGDRGDRAGGLIRGARIVPARAPAPSEPIDARIYVGLSGKSPGLRPERLGIPGPLDPNVHMAQCTVPRISSCLMIDIVRCRERRGSGQWTGAHSYFRPLSRPF
jgi:hypothetical protein